MLLNIETGTDNPILRKKSKRVSKFDKKLKKFAKDMKETMLAKDGVGLAAPQVGMNERVITINFQIDGKKPKVIVLVNPEILETSAEIEAGEEGCLSLPEIYGIVKRFYSATVRFQDESGKAGILKLEGMNARALQHEIDHLDGVLFVDRVEGEVKKIKPKKA